MLDAAQSPHNHSYCEIHMKAKTCFVAGAISAAAIATAFAHGGASGIVKERMDAMGVMSDVMKALTPIMRGERDYDADAVRQGATQIRRHAGASMADLFPEGSDGEPSEARAEIWTNWDEFQGLAERLELLATGLEQAAGNGLMMAPRTGSGASNMMGTGKAGNGMMGGSTMMGSGMMGGDAGQLPDADALAAMPADGVFNMVAQACSSCHTRFRLEKN